MGFIPQLRVVLVHGTAVLCRPPASKLDPQSSWVSTGRPGRPTNPGTGPLAPYNLCSLGAPSVAIIGSLRHGRRPICLESSGLPRGLRATRAHWSPYVRFSR